MQAVANFFVFIEFKDDLIGDVEGFSVNILIAQVSYLLYQCPEIACVKSTQFSRNQIFRL